MYVFVVFLNLNKIFNICYFKKRLFENILNSGGCQAQR